MGNASPPSPDPLIRVPLSVLTRAVSALESRQRRVRTLLPDDPATARPPTAQDVGLCDVLADCLHGDAEAIQVIHAAVRTRAPGNP